MIKQMNISAYADQNHAQVSRAFDLKEKSVGKEVQEEKKDEHCS